MSPAECAGLPQRRFLALLGLSVAVHGAVLFGVPLPSPPPVPAMLAALQATLRLPATTTVAVAAHEAAPAPSATKVRPPPARRELRALPAALEAAGPTVAAAVPSPAVEPSPAAVGAPAPVAAAAPPPAAADAAGAPPAPPAATDVDAARRLADYGARLSELFSRQQQYPRLALQRGWEGEVRVRLSVARRGSLAAIRLERSSGHAVLDRHALAMIEALGELPPPPAEFLKFSDDVQVVVPIHYRLRKAT